MISVFQKVKMPPLWAKCLIVSVTLHSVALYVLAQNPILLKKSWSSLFSPSKPLPKYIGIDEEWNPDTVVLQHFFEEFPPLPKKNEHLLSSSALASLLPLQEAGEKIVVDPRSSFFLREYPSPQRSARISSTFAVEPEEIAFNVAPFSYEILPQSAYANPILHEFSLEQPVAPQPLQINQIPDILSTSPLKERAVIYVPKTEGLQALQEDKSALPLDPLYPLPKSEDLFTKAMETPGITHFIQETPQQSLAGASLSDISDYLSEELISAIEWNNDFDVKASLFPEQDGYVFSLAVTPKQDFSKQKIKQNFYFIIDNSFGIEKHKLSVFKRSVLKALSALQPGDSFNVFLMDKKTVKLSPSNLIVSPKNISLAEDFLEKKGDDRPLFSSLDLKQGLSDLLKCIENDDEVHTAVLLSNGKSSLDPKEIRLFVDRNQGKINLFTAAAGQNNHLTFLDMLSSFSGGSLFYSDTNASFPRKLALFVKGLEAPLAKNLTFSLHANQPNAELQISTSRQLPNLYNKEPFVIMGKMDRLCDLHLVLQGSSAEDQIFLKKVIHFEEATTPVSSVKKAWLLHQKAGLYEKFLKESKPVYLNNAKDILKTVYGKAFTE